MNLIYEHEGSNPSPGANPGVPEWSIGAGIISRLLVHLSDYSHNLSIAAPILSNGIVQDLVDGSSILPARSNLCGRSLMEEQPIFRLTQCLKRQGLGEVAALAAPGSDMPGAALIRKNAMKLLRRLLARNDDETLKKQIDAMTHEEMAYAWRFGPLGDPMFQGEAGKYFEHRFFHELGGFSPEISKRLGL